MKTSIIIPTYNERENLEFLVLSIDKILDDYEIVVVDDSSPDGTFDLARELSENYPVTPLKREKKLGLASAVVHGFQNAQGEILGVIDADLQHPPELLKEMVNLVEAGSDVVLASRYVSGGHIEGWTAFRKLVSRIATLLARLLTSAKDPQTGYFLVRREVIEDVVFKPRGFKILLEILVKGKYKKLNEVPFTFRIREKGKSKFNRSEVLSYLRLLVHLYWYRLGHAKR